MAKLRDRRIILTGASSGLGRQIAKTFDEEGAQLLLVDRDEAGLRVTAELAPRAELRVVDLAAENVTAQIVCGAWEAPDTLVNCAGIQGPVGPSWQVDWADWQRCITVDLMAPVALCHACIPGMIQRGGGKIINLSGGGATGPRPRFTAYATAKSALVRFSESLAQELAGSHVDVNCIAPGAMPTAMLDGVFALGAAVAGESEYEAILRARRDGQVVIAKAVGLCLYLASSESNGITGKLISALWDPWRDFQAHAEELTTADIYTLRRVVPKDRGKDWGG